MNIEQFIPNTNTPLLMQSFVDNEYALIAHVYRCPDGIVIASPFWIEIADHAFHKINGEVRLKAIIRGWSEIGFSHQSNSMTLSMKIGARRGQNGSLTSRETLGLSTMLMDSLAHKAC